VAKQTAIALRAESLSRPRVVGHNRPPIRIYAENVARGHAQYMHARQNLKRQRKRVPVTCVGTLSREGRSQNTMTVLNPKVINFGIAKTIR
jgi:hypothetical protein